MTKTSAVVVWSPQAEADLVEIWLYGVREHSPSDADRYLREIYTACTRLRDWPYSGRVRFEIAPNVRSISVPPHVAFYRVTDSAIEIVRVLHGRRDFETIFPEE